MMPAMPDAKQPSIGRFFGLNNVTDPLRLDRGWLTAADNVNVTDTGAMAVRDGYTRVKTGAFSGAYSTFDAKRMYLVDGGELKTFDGSVLQSGVGSAPMAWAEINDQVYFCNGSSSGVIGQDNTVLPWSWSIPDTLEVAAVTGNLDAGLYRACVTLTLADGRETGASDHVEIELVQGQSLQFTGIPQQAGCRTNIYLSPANSAVFQYAGTPLGSAWTWNAGIDALGSDLLWDFDPLPAGCDVIQAWGGRMYAAQYLPTEGHTVIWYSQPLAMHLFDTATDFFLVNGRVSMLAPHTLGLVIGADERIYSFDGSRLGELAKYGVVPGQHWAKDGEKLDDRIVFWTKRGVCAALPFTNLTESQVSVAPGLQAGGAIVRSGGQKRYLVALHQGGSAFNAFN